MDNGGDIRTPVAAARRRHAARGDERAAPQRDPRARPRPRPRTTTGSSPPSLGPGGARPHDRRVQRRRPAHQGGAARARGHGAPAPPRPGLLRAARGVAHHRGDPGHASTCSTPDHGPMAIDELDQPRRRHRERGARRSLRRAARRQPVGARAPHRRRAGADAARCPSRGGCGRGRRSSSSPSTSCSTPRCASSPSTAWPARARRSSPWPPASSR